MEFALVGLVWAGAAVGMVFAVARLLGTVVERTAQAMWGPAAVAQAEPEPVVQPEPQESMFPPWEEEPWSLETGPGPPVG